ncbi:MAG: hypothetical protein F6K44_34115, partial [Moorea sp. SIO3E2]|nr:hypothetical protein [Moorena sp. SIO3E2]
MTTSLQPSEPVVYQGQFGEFTITESDRIGVVIYRAGLVVAALSFAIASNLILLRGASPSILNVLTPLYGLFCLALGV